MLRHRTFFCGKGMEDVAGVLEFKLFRRGHSSRAAGTGHSRLFILSGTHAPSSPVFEGEM